MNYDPTGLAVDNRVLLELINKPTDTLKIELSEGVFFVNRFILDGFDDELGNYRRMLHGIDFIYSPIYKLESDLNEKFIFSYVIILNMDKWSSFRSSYNALGGDRVDTELQERINNKVDMDKLNKLDWLSLSRTDGKRDINELSLELINNYSAKVSTEASRLGYKGDKAGSNLTALNETEVTNIVTDSLSKKQLTISNSVPVSVVETDITTHANTTDPHSNLVTSDIFDVHSHPNLMNNYATTTVTDATYLKQDDVYSNSISGTRYTTDTAPFPEILNADARCDVVINGTELTVVGGEELMLCKNMNDGTYIYTKVTVPNYVTTIDPINTYGVRGSIDSNGDFIVTVVQDDTGYSTIDDILIAVNDIGMKNKKILRIEVVTSNNTVPSTNGSTITNSTVPLVSEPVSIMWARQITKLNAVMVTDMVNENEQSNHLNNGWILCTRNATPIINQSTNEQLLVSTTVPWESSRYIGDNPNGGASGKINNVFFISATA